MKIGDLVMFYDGHIPYAEPVLIVCNKTVPWRSEFLVMNNLGRHWVDATDLVKMDEWEEIINESR